MGKMSDLYYIDDAELGNVLNNFARYTINVQAKINSAVRSATRKIGSAARRKAPFNPLRTSGTHLNKSIKTSVKLMKKQDGQAVGIVKTAAPHAHLLEFGTKPHIVAPKRKKVMRINANGIIRFVKGSISNGGISPRPFLSTAFNENKDKFIREVKEAIK